MRKIFFAVIALAITMISVTSCNNDEFTEDDALVNELELLSFKDSLMRDSLALVLAHQDSVAKYLAEVAEIERVRDSLLRYGTIEYSVKVYNASENSTYKSTNDAGTEGVVVTIAQNGYIVSGTTDAAGLVIFKDMRIGVANVSIQSDDYTDVAYMADITPSGASHTIDMGNNPGSSRYHVASQIAVFALNGVTNATIEGKMTIDTDLTNDAPENAAGVTVVASIDVNDAGGAFTKYLDQTTFSTSDYVGEIIKISYSDVFNTAVTNATGEYSISVPSSPDGVPYNVTVSDFAADQTLLLNQRWGKDVFGVQTVRAIYGPDASATSIPTVAPAYISIAAPTGGTNLDPETDAQAVAVVTKSGVEAIHITSTGDGYTQAPNVTINSTTGENAAAVATIDAQGRVNDIVVSTAGLGYGAGTTVALEESAEHAELEAVIENTITEITVGANGSGYTSAPAVTIHGDGSGATATAIMTGIVEDNFTVTNGGSGYTQVPDVLLTGGSGSGATATATLSNYGPIARVDVVNTIWYPGTTTVFDIDFASAYGSGATANAVIDNTAGRILNLTITDAGAGYTQIPTLTIGGNARVRVTGVAAGAITGVAIDFRGSDYTSIPSISVIPAPGDVITTAAAITASIEYPLTGITITGGGDDYTTGATSISINTVNQTANLTPVISRSVEEVNLGVAGTGYASAPSVQIITKDGDTGVGATANVTITQTVDAIEVTNAGQGYVTGNTLVSIEASPTGNNATATITGMEGVLASVNILDGGSGYTADPYITLTGGLNAGNPDAYQAELDLTLTAGVVTGVTVVDQGVGYTSAPTIGLSTYKTAATAKAETNPTAGQVEQINITVAGKGYVVAPIVEIEDLQGAGSGATAVAEIGENGTVININVTNGGSGYYKAPAIKLVVPQYATTATATLEINEAGVVTSITNIDGGQGYVTAPAITITPAIAGIGSGATASAVITNGKVTNIKLSNGGSGYLGQNTPGSFGGASASVGGNTAGMNIKYFNRNLTDQTVVAGKTHIIDVYLGTGERIAEY